jgi:hypothetical protein
MSVRNYSFLDTSIVITGPGGSFELSEMGVAAGGVSLQFNERTSMTEGADGSVMHTLKAAKTGSVTIRFLKNGDGNSVLDRMFNSDNGSAANVGKNTISVRNVGLGDSWTASQCAFVGKPAVVYGTEGPELEWRFNAGRIDGTFGTGPGVA